MTQFMVNYSLLIRCSGRFEHDIKKVDGGISVDGHTVKIFSEKDPT